MRLIDADKLLCEIEEELSRECKVYTAEQNKWIDTGLRIAAADIRHQPTVDAVPVVHGRWIHCQGKSNLWYCSECGEKILYNPTRRTYNIEKRPVHEVNKYCRGCGAKMDGVNEDG